MMFNQEVILFVEKSLLQPKSDLALLNNPVFYNKLRINCINQIAAFLTRIIKRVRPSKDDYNLAEELNAPCLTNNITALDLCLLCGFADLAARLITNGAESKCSRTLMLKVDAAPTNENLQAIQAIAGNIEMSKMTISKRKLSVNNYLLDNKYATGYFALGSACVIGAVLIHNPLTWFGFASIGIPAIFAGVNSLQNHEGSVNNRVKMEVRDNFQENLEELETMLNLTNEIRNNIMHEEKIRELKDLLLQRSKSSPKLAASPSSPKAILHDFEAKQSANQPIDRQACKTRIII